jgi:hypothetical protein
MFKKDLVTHISHAQGDEMMKTVPINVGSQMNLNEL